MCSGDKKCLRKTRPICWVLCLFLSVLCCLFSSYSASALQPNHYNARYSTHTLSPDSWHYDISNNQVFNVAYLLNYQWYLDSVYFTGNYANIHFETNIVMANALGYYSEGDFRNLKFLQIDNCFTGSTSLPLKSRNVSYTTTNWRGGSVPAPTLPDYKTTLTIYGDVVLGDIPANTTGSLYCGIGLSNGWAFAEEYHDDTITSVPMWFEQTPILINFTSSEDDALQKQQIQAIQGISDSIDKLADDNDEMEVYEREQQDLQDKGDELEQDSADLSLSAQTPSVPFFRWFFNPWQSGTRCQTLQYLPRLFNGFSASTPAWVICSPVPDYLWAPFTLISNFFFAAILLRLYFKKLKGGVDG